MKIRDLSYAIVLLWIFHSVTLVSGAGDTIYEINVVDVRTFINTTNYFSIPQFDGAGVSQCVLLGGSTPETRAFTNGEEETFLRLTDSIPLQAGQIYYENKVRVRYGFSSTFKFRVRGNHTRIDSCLECMDRQEPDGDQFLPLEGADGFAFIIVNDAFDQWNVSYPLATGTGSTLGYDGLKNAFIVEFDLWGNDDLLDPMDAHVSVMFRGNDTASSSHDYGFKSSLPPAYGSAEHYKSDEQHGDAIEIDPIYASDEDFTYTSPTSFVNYIMPNVTPMYNWAPLSNVRDGKTHTAKIVYDYPQDVYVYVDDMDHPLLQVQLNLSKLTLDESYECEYYEGCFKYVDDEVGNYFDADNDIHVLRDRYPQCIIYDSFTNMKNTIFLSNVTSDKYGELYDPSLYTLSISNRNLLQCYRCRAYEPCTALVGLFATTGVNVQRHEVFDWDFISSDPPVLEEKPFYQNVPEIQELDY
eukprot:TRINITY_DN592_c1_g2_i1.p1 TRINITY_DN592_c1_g2~~TRINITY_DN592_c1_g2_i1.p1  ORF type:complete len:469 (+),score=107.51 TRINITY_DN592_c1_g2_i1:40-1446(+)